MSGTGGGPRERDRGTGWMRCAHWSVCRRCAEKIETGQWQALVEVPDAGRRWVHETCALELGATARPLDASAPTTIHATPALPRLVRIVVIGSAGWPRERAVEVRDGIEAVARGHREVVIVHSARRDERGSLCGVDAWAQLTATRLGYAAEPHDSPSTTVDELHALRPTVVVAFPLKQPGPPGPAAMVGAAGPDDPVETLAAAAELAGVPVLMHRMTTTATPAG